MAFEIPSHLPRASSSKDPSTSILYKLDEVSSKTLTSSVASSWVTELEETVGQTKTKIHERIHSDLPEFEAQLASARSIQARLQTLSASASALSAAQSSLLVDLLPVLKRHASLQQDASDAKHRYEALAHLSECNEKLKNAESTVQAGQLALAHAQFKDIDSFLESAPEALQKAEVMTDMKRRLATLRSETDELLEQSYAKCVLITPEQLTILPSVLVAKTAARITLSEIFATVSPQILNLQLSAINKAILSQWIDRPLLQPVTIVASTTAPTLQQSPAPPDSPLVERLSNTTAVTKFVSTHLVPHLPSSANGKISSWPTLLSSGIQRSILQNLVIPLLPNTVDDLPAYLDLLSRSVQVEDDLLEDFHTEADFADHTIMNWVADVRGHYERQRRSNILAEARSVIIRVKDETSTFDAIYENPESSVTDDDLSPSDQIEKVNGHHKEGIEDEDESNWGFNDDDDDESGGQEKEVPSPIDSVQRKSQIERTGSGEAGGWGWDEEEEAEDEDEDEDDPWAEPKPKATPRKNGSLATRVSSKSATKTSHETCIISTKVKSVLDLVQHSLEEADAVSKFAFPGEGSTLAGDLIASTTSGIIDIYLAFSRLVSSTSDVEDGIRLSLDCWWLHKQLLNKENTNLERSRQRLSLLTESLFTDSIESQCQAAETILDSADGFMDLGDNKRFSAAQASVSRLVDLLTTLGTKWSASLPKIKYYPAIGSVVESALLRILEDILSLNDIPELESRRLGEICRMSNSLESIFVGDNDEPSFIVSYVPSWLKFSYLSELLEASMADVSYLFEEGALVDFKVEELVKLVQALFSDTPLRRNTIEKLQQGHPDPS